MRTSLNEIKLIDNYLNKELSIADQLLFDARLIISPELRRNVRIQRRICNLLLHYRKTRQREELEDRYSMMMARSETQKTIRNLFNQ